MSVRHRLAVIDPFTVTGKVAAVVGAEIEVRGLRLRVGDTLAIHAAAGDLPSEVVALGSEGARALLFSTSDGVGRSDLVSRRPAGLAVPVGDDLLGRVLDGLGRPMDGGRDLGGESVTVRSRRPDPLQRLRIDTPLPVGVRVIDTLCTVGRGQRVGLFGGSGVGKSTLLGMMARGTTADVNVLALVGERGREVREFIEDDLGPEGMQRTVVVVATSDQPALMRTRAAFVATRIAEWFADRGRHVLLMMDSLTRLAMAQREVGLAAGEPVTGRGYTPSVFSMMAHLLEQAGPRSRGTVTAFYTVLVEGDDMNDPIADSARAILDGHVVLDRRLAMAGRYPAIDPLASMSRLADKVVDPEHRHRARTLQATLSAVEDVRELVEVGAYVAGTNPEADRGLGASDEIKEFLTQPAGEVTGFDDGWAQLQGLMTALVGEVAA
jgi:flagellum-specific ATP synthase